MASARWSEEDLARHNARKLGTTIKEVFAQVRPVADEVIRKAENKAKHDKNAATESDAKILLIQSVRDLEALEPEYRFQVERGYKSCRFDLAAVAQRLGIEIEGGQYTQGRHNRASGFEKDARKYNDAALRGWRVLRFTYAMIHSGEAAETIRRALT